MPGEARRCCGRSGPRRARATRPSRAPDHRALEGGLTPPSPGTASCMRFASGSWELYAETFGAAGDPAVVLLHGAGNSMMAWDAELCEAIAGRGRFVVRLDSRDAGRSARRGDPGPSTMDDLAADVIALLDALDLPGATLAGVSQGGITAQIVAAEHPARVTALVLISTTPGGDDLPGPVEGLFAGGPEAPDWADRAAVVRYLVEVERPYGAAALRRGADDPHRRAHRRPRDRPRRPAAVPVRGRGRRGRRATTRSARRPSSSTGPPTRCSRSSTAARSPPRSRAPRSSRSTASATPRSRATSGPGSSS